MPTLDRFHARVVRSRWLQRFTAATRLLLAVGFIGPGAVKVMGHRFTQLPTSDPVGLFFDAFFQAGEFYVFVGLVQVVAGLLLVWPRTATLGAVLYTPVILNVTVITWSIGFSGTRWITLLMSLACLWLLAWDYDRLKAILPLRRAAGGGYARREYLWMSALGAVGGAAGALLAVATGLANAHRAPLPIAAALVGGGAAFGLAVAWHVRHLPAAPGDRPAGPPPGP